MPRPIKAGDISQGHCWFPTPSIPGIGQAQRVFCDGRPVIAVGDSYLPHIPGCTPIPTTHPVQAVVGSPNVFVGGLPIVRDGDPLSCGDVANTPDGTVFLNGGGLGPQGQADPGATIGFSVGLPIVTYPSLTFRYTAFDVGGERVFRAGCNGSFNPEMYTTLFEDGSGQQYRNYPGPPHSTLSGGQNLPSYANDNARNPIPILGITVSVDNGTTILAVNDGNLGDGLRIDSSGRVFGRLTGLFQTKILHVRARNLVGLSQDFTFVIHTQEVLAC